MTLRQEIFNYVKKQYKTTPEYPWHSYPDYAVLRHAQTTSKKKPKWYALIMDIKPSVIGLKGEDYIDVMNVKLDPDEVIFLQNANGFRPAYHMSKKHWVTVLLDGSVPMEQIKDLLAESFELTK